MHLFPVLPSCWPQGLPKVASRPPHRATARIGHRPTHRTPTPLPTPVWSSPHAALPRCAGPPSAPQSGGHRWCASACRARSSKSASERSWRTGTTAKAASAPSSSPPSGKRRTISSSTPTAGPDLRASPLLCHLAGLGRRAEQRRVRGHGPCARPLHLSIARPRSAGQISICDFLLISTPGQEPETEQQPKGVLATAQSCKAGSTIPAGSHDKLGPA
jgi:hypothetical protein